MQGLSDRERALVDRLYNLDLTALEELAVCSGPRAIPHIAPLLLTGTAECVQTGAQVLADLLARTRPEDLVWLDELARGLWAFRSRYGLQWCELDADDIAHWDGPRRVLLPLASFHGNGFVREEAVRRLALVRDGSELPYLLLRLNDWVYKVRQAALDAVSDRVGAEYLNYFIESLALVARLERAGRVDHTWILAKTAGLLTHPATRPAMATALGHPSTQVRRAAFRYLFWGEPADWGELLPCGLQAKDPIIRLWSLRKAVAALDPERLLPNLESLSADRSPAVRRESLRELAGRFPEEARGRLQAALLDPAPSIRATARYHLRGQDFAQFYREAASSASLPGRLSAAIAGLAETGAPADAERLVPYLEHTSVRVRRLAVSGVLRLGGDQYAELVLGCVSDRSPGVSNQAARVLRPHAGTLGVRALWTAFARPGPNHVRLNLLSLIASLSKWESIPLLVQITADREEAVAALAHEKIRRWNERYNATSVTPTQIQIQLVKFALDRWGSNLTATEREPLQFAVKSACR